MHGVLEFSSRVIQAASPAPKPLYGMVLLGSFVPVWKLVSLQMRNLSLCSDSSLGFEGS